MGSGFTGENSANTVTKVIEENELAISAALNDIELRKMDASAYEQKLGSGFTGENSANTVTKVIEENELAISAALNDIELRKLDASAYTPADLSDYYTKGETSGNTEISAALSNKVDTSALNRAIGKLENNMAALTPDAELSIATSTSTHPIQTQAVFSVIKDNEEVISAALNDLRSLISDLEDRVAALENNNTP